MGTYITPSVSSHPCSQDFNYNNMMSSLQNLDLSSGNRGSCSRNNDHGGIYASHYSCFSPKPQCVDHNDHGGIYASHYSCFSPKPQCVDQDNTVRGQQLLDRTPLGSQSNGELPYAPVPSAPPSFVDTHERLRINVGPRNSGMYKEASQVPGISLAANGSPAYGLSYGCSTMNRNGYFGQGFTQSRSNGQNGYYNQAFTEPRGNGQNGYGNQEFTERTNTEGIVSMAMRNEQSMFLHNAVVVELAQCMRILNGILRRALPQLEAKMAVPRDGQQTPNRISGSAQGSPGPTIPTRIFVGGLASSVTESDFKTYFDQFGTITNVEVKYDHITQRTRGFGFITFDSEKAVEKVLHRTSFHELNGKMVEVKRAFPKDLYRKSIRGQLGGLNYGLRKVSNLLGAYTQANSPSQVGGSGN